MMTFASVKFAECPSTCSPFSHTTKRGWIELTIAKTYRIVAGDAPLQSAIGLLTVPEVFTNVDSAQFLLVSNVA